jgi:hypothetical protein
VTSLETEVIYANHSFGVASGADTTIDLLSELRGLGKDSRTDKVYVSVACVKAEGKFCDDYVHVGGDAGPAARSRNKVVHYQMMPPAEAMIAVPDGKLYCRGSDATTHYISIMVLAFKPVLKVKLEE